MIKKLFLSLCFVLMLSSGLTFSADKVNVNTATSEQLQVIKGIGPVTAKSIITYRTEHGDFKVIADLVNIKGIGSKTVEKLIPQVSVK